MKLGYIRISTDKQTVILQQDALKKEQCDRLYTDKMSGKRFDRPELLRMIDEANPGDVIVVWRLDRLGRSLKQLIENLNELKERGIELRSIKESIDTTTPTGKLMFHIIGAMAEFERDVIQERTKAGLEAARARGRMGGRRPVITRIKPQTLTIARDLYERREMTVKDIMESCGLTGRISRGSFYKYIVNATKGEE